MNFGLKTTAAAMVAAMVVGTVANAAVVRVTEAAFVAGSGQINFDEFAVGTVNPTYNPGDYGGGVGTPVVTFDGFFTGQSLSATPGIDCPGASPTACVVGAPTGTLTLDAASPNTKIVQDGAAPNSPVLSGSPTFNGPIAVLFDTDQFGVGFDAGFFDAIGSTAITAFARDGTLLGSVANLGKGIEFLGLVSDSADIAGVFLELVGLEPAGFAIDSLRFGKRGTVVVPGIPLPAGLPLMAGGLILLGAIRRKKRS